VPLLQSFFVNYLTARENLASALFMRCLGAKYYAQLIVFRFAFIIEMSPPPAIHFARRKFA